MLAGCNQTQQLSAVIQTGAGEPLPGAIFYAEAYDNDGTFDFVFAVADEQGRVPASGETLQIRWGLNAKLALAVFAPGMKPVAFYDQLGRLKADGIVILLEQEPAPGYRWEPRVGHLGYPFEKNPELAIRVAGDDHRLLREAFTAAYAPLADREESAVPREIEKMKFMQSLGN
jgi:hypothetical protein